MTEQQRETRELEIRAAVDTAARTVSGVGVPYGEIITIWGEREMFAHGSVRAEGAKLLYRHAEPIGLVTSAVDDKTGWNPTAKISATARGDEAYQLAQDGVLDGFSVGFKPLKWHMERDDQGEFIVYDEVIVREVSLVPFPAYPSARVKEVRHDPTTNHREEPIVPDTQTETPEQQRAADIQELREGVEDVQRSLAVIQERGIPTAQPTVDNRSAGEVLKAIIAGDQDTIRAYEQLQERAYAGGTSADAAIKDGWVGDLTRIFDASSGVLADSFEEGTLPATGMNIEFSELDVNSITVTEQVNEGDDLPIGKVSLKTRTAEVKTFGGASALTRQEVERSQLPILDRNLEALAMAAGVRHKIVLRTAYNELVTARVALDDVIDVPAAFTAEDWLDAVVDGALNFEDKGAAVDRLLANASVFKKLNKLKVDGQRIFSVDGSDKTVGTLDLTHLKGDIASLEVRLDSGADRLVDSAAFINRRAIRSYKTAVASLQDENVINLSKSFSVYRYGAVAAEIPGFVVPVKFGA